MNMLRLVLLRCSDWITALLRLVAHLASWVLLVLVLVVCFDVLSRKLGWRIPNFDATRLQELAWHLQAVVFCAWLGYAYTQNAHVRVDVVAARFSTRTRRWIEVAGCLLLAFPYLLVATPYAETFFLVAWKQNEGSSSPGGLPYRWVIKGVLYLGLWGLLLANAAVLMRSLAQLIGADPEDGDHAHG